VIPTLVGWLEVHRLRASRRPQRLPRLGTLGKAASGRGRPGVGADPATGVKRCWELGLLLLWGGKKSPRPTGVTSVPRYPVTRCLQEALPLPQTQGFRRGPLWGRGRGVPGCRADPPAPRIVPGALGPAPCRLLAPAQARLQLSLEALPRAGDPREALGSLHPPEENTEN